MADFSVLQWIDGEQADAAEDLDFWTDWEGEAFRRGCAHARELARELLEDLDLALMRNRPGGLLCTGKRDRTIATAFGDLTVSRRMYRDADGETAIPLDEYLGWKPRRLASPAMAELAALMATLMPFRAAEEIVSKTTAGALSKTTIHRLLRGVGEDALSDERERWEAQFERGEDVCDGDVKADTLYVEADGVWVKTQREDKKSYEVKADIAYSGRRKVGEDRYELAGKRAYCHASGNVPFWEGAIMEWGKLYDLGSAERFVVGGDGANWIRAGADYLPNAAFQLDGFHLSRARGVGCGEELGAPIYAAMRAGDASLARALMSSADEAETKAERGTRRYAESNVEVGMDWRVRVPDAPPDALGLGAMESNCDKLIVHRMKKRGMSWTIRGADLMAKAIQLSRSGELAMYCVKRGPRKSESAILRPASSSSGARSSRVSDWADASVPALRGPSASKPWASGLRILVHGGAY